MPSSPSEIIFFCRVAYSLIGSEFPQEPHGANFLTGADIEPAMSNEWMSVALVLLLLSPINYTPKKMGWEGGLVVWLCPLPVCQRF